MRDGTKSFIISKSPEAILKKEHNRRTISGIQMLTRVMILKSWKRWESPQKNLI